MLEHPLYSPDPAPSDFSYAPKYEGSIEGKSDADQEHANLKYCVEQRKIRGGENIEENKLKVVNEKI